MSVDPYQPPKSNVTAATTIEAAPPLWNPNAAANWSLIFTPILGAWLHMINWRAREGLNTFRNARCARREGLPGVPMQLRLKPQQIGQHRRHRVWPNPMNIRLTRETGRIFAE